MTESLSAVEERVVGLVRDGRDELIELVGELVAFDTTARGSATRRARKRACRRPSAARLRAIGAEVDIWEPAPTGTGNRFVPDDLDFKGRPSSPRVWPARAGVARCC